MARLDPLGKRALFEAPVAADRRQILSPGATPEGKYALFSTGPRQPGTVVIDCSGCEAATRVSLADVGLRLLLLSVWLPPRQPYDHLLRCPACHARRWCRIRWLD